MEFEDRVASPEQIDSSITTPDHDAKHAETEGEHAPEHATENSVANNDDSRHNLGEDGGLHDLRASAMKGTKHRTANIGMGTQVAANGKETGAPKDHKEAKVADAAHVDVVATEKAPIELAPGWYPAEQNLFTRVPKGGKEVTHRSGTTGTPNVTSSMLEDNLFIGGAPIVQDIRQGGLGDCFFQSCLLGVTQNDPAKIQSIMSISGGSVSVTLQHFDHKTSAFVPTTLKEDTALLTKKHKGHISLVGARMRIADAPKKTAWWAEVHGKTVEIHRRDIYETALWAPMMEKAYADFAQKHGKDGQGKDKAQKKLGGGYKIINAGGAVEQCYQMFYGSNATAGQTDIAFTPGNDIVADNIPAIQKLLTYQATKGNTAPGTTQGFMHARIGEEGAVKRGDALIDQVNNLLFGEQVGDDLGAALAGETTIEHIQRLLRTIDRTQLRTALITLQTALKKYETAKKKKADPVAKAAEAVATPDKFPHLWDDTLPAPFRQLRENLGILVNLGDDSSNKQRQNYASHAYQVRSVTLRDHTGAALALTAADLPARAGDIDAEKSTIGMHNPHARNEPDMRGTGPADGVNDGMFDYTLDQFLRNFDLLRMADVTH